jgi:hypothetical protein
MAEKGETPTGVRPFDVAHAMMALIAAGRTAATRIFNTLSRSETSGASAALPEDSFALPFCKALLAFACGDNVRCVESLKRVHHIARRCSGSLAQCDLIHLTYTEAALRARKPSLARVLFRLGGNNIRSHTFDGDQVFGIAAYSLP